MDKALEILEMVKKCLQDLADRCVDTEDAATLAELVWCSDLIEVCLKWLKEEGKQHGEERKAE